MASPLRHVADQAFSRAAGAPLVDGNAVDLLCDARENYPAWLAAIHAAERWIHFESYIIRDDRAGGEFADALIAAARRGVRVRLIYDWLGAVSATRWGFWKRLRRAGVEVRAFNRPRLDSPLGWLSRDHRKMIGVDGKVGFVTGLCVGDMWVGGDRRGGADPWRDTGVAVRGPAVADIEAAFADVWDVCGRALPRDERPTASDIAVAGTVAVRVIDTRPSSAGLFRLDQLVAAVARKRLWLTDAYFVGASPYVQGLVAAAADGVDVRLLMPGAGSDLPIVQQLTRSGYRQLLEAGVRIFEWNGAMLHAKTAVADGRWARVGSSNLNVQSWLGNWELDVAIEDQGFAARMEEVYLQDLQNATEITLARRRPRQAVPAAVGAIESAQPPAARGRGAGRTRRAATAGALRMGHTFGTALTAPRTLGAAEAVTLVWGTVLLSALGTVALLYPKAIAYPLGVLLLWIGLSWLGQAARLRRRRSRR
jgi:cardiolipin synthase